MKREGKFMKELLWGLAIIVLGFGIIKASWFIDYHVGIRDVGTPDNSLNINSDGSIDINSLKSVATLSKVTTYWDLNGSALDYTTSISDNAKLSGVMVKFTSAVSETVTVGFNSATSSNYDTVLDSATLSSNQNYFYSPNGDFLLTSGDEIDVDCTKAGIAAATTAYVTIIVEK